jgi:adenylate kinase
LSEKTGWPVISSGKQFRAIAAEDTPVGRKVKKEIDSGALMPHWFAMYLYQKALFSLESDTSAIFDGFNRKVPEAQLIVSSLGWLERPYTVVTITVSDKEVHRRLEKRKEIDKRADDEAVDERLKEYYAYTEDAIAVFRKEGTLVEVNGEQEPEKIAEDIREVLNIA